MRRVGNKYQEFCSFANLHLAWQKTRRGSGFTQESALFFRELESELLGLQNELVTGTWVPVPLRFFDIYDPKHREIAVSPFRDRVVHHALINVLEPIFEPCFIPDSFATRKGKGVHAAVFSAQEYLQINHYYLKSDIEKFFDSVPHDILLSIICRKIKDRGLIEMCQKVLSVSRKGLPIGSRTSQFFANVYLNHFDHFVKEKCHVKGFVRYMDDFVVFENNKKLLMDFKSKLAFFLFDELELTLKPTATFLNHRQNGLPFLGRRIFPNIIRLRTQNLRLITKRMDLLEKKLSCGSLTDEAFVHSMNAYWAMLSFYPELKPLRKYLIKK